MKEWDMEDGTPTQWAKKIDHPIYGKYECIELTYNNTFDVVVNDTILINCKSFTSAKRWVSINL